MPRLHLVIGDSNTRKSSLVRCLSGVFGGRSANQHMQIQQATGTVITVYCATSALQENLRPLSPSDFITLVNSMVPVPTDILITLRVNSRSTYPNAAQYVAAFLNAGWVVASVALLGASAQALARVAPAARIAAIPNSTTQPTNLTASIVRPVWGWL